jgi:DNA-binding HxlR family transcriptional regulator
MLELRSVPLRLSRGDTGGDAARHRPLPVEATLDFIGDRWKWLLVWQLFWGARPFSELMRATHGITRKTLRRELAELERHGLVRREVRFESGRRAEYALTSFGETLKPIVGAMYEWGLGLRGNPMQATSPRGAEQEADFLPSRRTTGPSFSGQSA